MTDQLSGIGAITVFVADRLRAKAFYERVFRARLLHEDDASVVFDMGNTMLNLLEKPFAEELLAPAVVGAPAPGPRSMLSIWVDDVDAVCADLRHAGVTLINGPIDREWGRRTAAFTDPDGTLWEVAQDLPERAGS
jgi:catechol 2,3-dioxygenase-like lactoylglutathione lyase family enzyme